MQLVIVESPTKAKKLRSFLGNDYLVEASVGHVRDLPKTGMGIDIDHDFEPTYEVSPDKKKVISLLKSQAKDADTIILATDPDREGEAISWHIQAILSEGKGKDKVTVPFVRATFHEITRSAVEAAIAHPEKLNMSLVSAQQARRVVDRLVGYEVSPVLWRKVRTGLSAGRVQSVALRLIVEREKEILAFKPEEYWEVDVALGLQSRAAKSTPVFVEGTQPTIPQDVLIARVAQLQSKKYEPKHETDVTNLRRWLPAAAYTVANVERKQKQTSSLPPFTTSTLQQSAANRLGFTSKQTMRLAQDMYEEGLITYHRTDAVTLSSQALDAARGYIVEKFSMKYLPERARVFANSSKNAQEAHEAIRVTQVELESVLNSGARMTDRHQKLYDLIRRRFIASQMASAVFDQTVIEIDAQGNSKEENAQLRSSGSVLIFDGWKRLFPISEDVVLPSVEPKQQLNFHELNTAQKFTQPPARYNDASLVKELEKRGIGRPSTYASIISVIIDRGYVERLEKRFQPTAIGTVVCDFLLQHFPVFMEYDFTAEMEDDLDRIARSEKEWHEVVRTFYTPFHAAVTTALESAERMKVPVEETGRVCPTCGTTDQGMLVIRTGKFGKFISCSRYPDCKYTERIVDKFGDYQCPDCKEGDVIVRKSRWGKPFYGCSRYPACTWATWRKPAAGAQFEPTTEKEREAKAERAAAKAAKSAPSNKPAKGKKAAKSAPTKKTAKGKKTTTSAKLTVTKKKTKKSAVN